MLLLILDSAGPERPHIYICLFICGVSALGYFAMLSGQGWTAIAGCRQFFYARYFDWAVTCSLIVLNLGLIAGAEPASIAATIAAEGDISLISIIHPRASRERFDFYVQIQMFQTFVCQT